jgi:hypothetical protein
MRGRFGSGSAEVLQEAGLGGGVEDDGGGADDAPDPPGAPGWPLIVVVHAASRTAATSDSRRMGI